MSNRQFFQDDAQVMLRLWAERDGLRWNVSVNQIINENVREPLSPSAMKRGIVRGSRNKWKTLPFHRVGHKKVFFEDDLWNWYQDVKWLLPMASDKAFSITKELASMTPATIH